MADTTPQLTLKLNDRVVYPNQGVCRVSGIDTKEIAGQKLVFVTLKREADSAVVMVPQAKLVSIGVRKVATPEDVQAVWDFLKSDSDKADLDWKQRARTNTERMAQGGIIGLAEVVKGLQVLSELRPLPTKERELYDNARHLLVSELSASMSVSECDAEDSIDVALSPPGKERPKRTAEEFKRPGEDEDLELGGDLLGLDDGIELPPDEEAPAEEEASEEAPAEEEGEEKPAAAAAKKPKKAAAPKVELSDEEVTHAMAPALVPDDQIPGKRKRGRPPKPKPEVDPGAPPPVPKKRGRPPKPKPAVDPNAPPPAPKKRGRPPKKK
ncbi:MAG: CarD family transcriptional regulator [Myxococcaceae bacterium]